MARDASKIYVYIYIYICIYIYIHIHVACVHAACIRVQRIASIYSHAFSFFFFPSKSKLSKDWSANESRDAGQVDDRSCQAVIGHGQTRTNAIRALIEIIFISFDWFKFELKRDSEWRVEKWREASIRRPIFSSPRGFLRFTFQIVLHLIHTWYYLSIVEESLWVETIEQRLTTLIEFSQSEMRTRAVRYFFTTTVTGNWWYRCTSFVFVVIVRSMKLWKKIRI